MGSCYAHTHPVTTQKTGPRQLLSLLSERHPPLLACPRRDLWHGRDMAGAGRRRALWNEALLGEAVAPLLAQAMELAAQQLGK